MIKAQEKQNDSPESMEDILHTIRGVISGENPKSAESDVLELTEIVGENGEVTSMKSEKQNDVLNNIDQALTTEPKIEEDMWAEALQENKALSENQTPPAETTENTRAVSPAPEQTNAEVAPPPPPTANSNDKEQTVKATLISPDSATETSQTLKNLVQSFNKPKSDNLKFRSGTSVEDLVVEVMKPMMKEWLDKNLPSIVKSIVEKEIKKLVPREDE